MPAWFFTLWLGIFGLLVGSFANVVIWRVPRGESIVSPGSHCPSCDTPIAGFDNVPLLSWLVLKGRCRMCGAPIAVRYPLVELASAVLFVGAALVFGPGVRAVIAAVFFWLLLVLSVIDLDHLRLPNPLVGAMALIGAMSAAVAEVTGHPLVPLVGTAATGLLSHPLAAAAAGLVLGAGLSAGVAAAYGAIRGKHGLGMGDVKFLAALGIFLGPYVLLSLFLGSVLGMVVGLVAARGGKLADTRIPFGPWLSVGAALTVVIGPALLEWYLRLAGLT